MAYYNPTEGQCDDSKRIGKKWGTERKSTISLISFITFVVDVGIGGTCYCFAICSIFDGYKGACLGSAVPFFGIG